MVLQAPSPIVRPKLARFIQDRDLLLREAAAALDCSYEQVRIICLPFDDPNRRVPKTALLGRIVEWTAGEVTAADFYPPHLTAAQGTPCAEEPSPAPQSEGADA